MCFQTARQRNDISWKTSRRQPMFSSCVMQGAATCCKRKPSASGFLLLLSLGHSSVHFRTVQTIWSRVVAALLRLTFISLSVQLNLCVSPASLSLLLSRVNAERGDLSYLPPHAPPGVEEGWERKKKKKSHLATQPKSQQKYTQITPGAMETLGLAWHGSNGATSLLT